MALWFIFLDHIPDNSFGWLTLRQYGFSDTTEVFMFVSGVTCALAYDGIRRCDGWGAVVSHTLRRSWEIYAAFILLIVAIVILVYWSGSEAAADDANVRILLREPGVGLAHAAVLLYRPVNTDVLPTFVLFHLAFAPLLWSVLKFPNATLAASALLYLLVQLYGWNLPQWPVNQWYFNPLAWQFLVVLGAWWVTGGNRKLRRRMSSWPVVALAAAYLVFSLIVALSWEIKSLAATIPASLATLIYPIDKPDLDPLRLLHFLAIAIVIARVVPPDWRGFSLPGMKAAIRCGEHSLETYCFGVLLSLAAHLLLVGLGGGLAAQFVVSVVGILALVAFATCLTWIGQRTRRRPRLM